MAADNVKTGFCLPSGVNEDIIRNLIRQHHQTQQHQKNINRSNNKISTSSHQKVFRNVYGKRPVLKSLFNEVSGPLPAALSKKRLQQRCFLVKSSNTSGRLLVEEHKILLKVDSIAIPNNISKAYYQKWF